MDPRIREYQCEGFRLNVVKRELRNPKGVLQELPARAFDALVFLVEHRHEEVAKEQIIKALWPDTIVEENNLNQAIYSLRRALGDSANGSRFIKTLPGRGYRFIAEVRQVESGRRRPAHARLAAIGIAGALALAALVWAFATNRGPHRAPASVAVLPFKALLPDQSEPALELGMTDSLIARISAIPGLKVTSLGSVRRFAASNQDPLAAGNALGVETVLDSSILKQGERVRVTTRLLRVSDGQSLWAGKFDEPISDILGVQDSISERVAQTLAPHLSTGTTLARVRKPTENAEAYRLYAEGFYNHQRRDLDGLPAAVKNYEAALLLDPGYVQAWGALSRALAAQAVFGTRPPMSVLPRAKEAAMKAVELDAESADAHAALAHVLVVYDHQYKLAEEEYAIAKRLDPTVPEFYLLSSINQANLGRVDASLAEARHALELEPASLVLRANLGMLLYFARSYDEAEMQFRRVIALQPRFDHARNLLGRTLLAKGDVPGALREFAARINPSPGSYANPGVAYVLSGRRREAQLEIDRLQKLGAQGFGVNYDLATIHAALGNMDLACAALAAALTDESAPLGTLQLDPAMDPLRTMPCFAEVSHQLYADPRR